MLECGCMQSLCQYWVLYLPGNTRAAEALVLQPLLMGKVRDGIGNHSWCTTYAFYRFSFLEVREERGTYV
jgi:hypothetical protein